MREVREVDLTLKSISSSVICVSHCHMAQIKRMRCKKKSNFVWGFLMKFGDLILHSRVHSYGEDFSMCARGIWLCSEVLRSSSGNRTFVEMLLLPGSSYNEFCQSKRRASRRCRTRPEQRHGPSVKQRPRARSHPETNCSAPPPPL